MRSSLQTPLLRSRLVKVFEGHLPSINLSKGYFGRVAFRRKSQISPKKTEVKLVPREGLEPSTNWLRVNCSTNWATEATSVSNPEPLQSGQSFFFIIQPHTKNAFTGDICGAKNCPPHPVPIKNNMGPYAGQRVCPKKELLREPFPIAMAANLCRKV